MKNARLTVYLRPRNPSDGERTILKLLAGGYTQKQAARHLGLAHCSVNNAMGRMRDRYAAPTNEALIALAIQLYWVGLARSILARTRLNT